MPRLLALLVLALVTLRTPAQGAPAAGPTDRPNILFVLADDLRRDAVGAFDHAEAAHTPHLDALAAEGACRVPCARRRVGC